MPTLRANRAIAAAQSISGFLVHIVRGRERRERFTASSSEDSDEDYSEETSSSSSSDTSTSSDTEDELPLSPRTYHTRAVDRNRAASSRVRSRSGIEPLSSSGNPGDSRSERSQSEEVTRDESERTVMDAGDDEIQLIEDDGPFPADRNIRTTPSNSDDELDAANRPKRRRTGTPASQDNGNPKTGASEGGVASSAMHSTNDDSFTDDGCSICYEDYTSAGEHRLASIKCGHFFGYSCITRWIRTEGRNAVCPTCKTKTNLRDVRKHYTSAVKVADTTEVEMLRNSNAALHIRVSGLEVDLARKDHEISELMNKLRGNNASGSEAPYQMVIQPVRSGRMFMVPERKEALIIGPANADARAFDYNGDCWAVGVACSQAGNLFCPYGIRMLIINQQEFKLRECYPLHSARSRVVVFSPFESTVLLSGGEDKRAVVSMNGTILRQWKMPNEKPIWSGCWTAHNRVALGLGDGRVFEYAVDSDSTEPLRDYTQGIGHLPIIFTGFDTGSSTLLVASFKKLMAFRNEKVFPLLSNVQDQFDKMRSISFLETSLHLVVSFSPGGRHPAISHRLYRLAIEDDNDEVLCIELSEWLTDCQLASTMWSNSLFSLENNLFSVVYNEDKRRFDAHDWSERRADVMVSFPSRSTVAAIRAIPTASKSRKTIVVLSDRALFSISFGLLDSTS